MLASSFLVIVLLDSPRIIIYIIVRKHTMVARLC